MTRRSLTYSICLILTQLSGCTAETAQPAEPAAVSGEMFSFAAEVQPLITAACNCHQSTPILMAPFSLKVGEAYDNLVDTPSMQLPSMLLVDPGSLNTSYLWHKLNDTQATVGGSGAIMPSTIPLNAEELRVFERWIAAGAQP